ncbi:TAXI family TRAP transporter solute-binding subunit [Sneathiella marina]|uniref:TAXI family TRAP transporter solute-binding subunit n=1 Tax=Sneathiella marina TaxID=2950108 RepID=A0ABY4W4G3_9PROT|nr:TAXI family TRAP transporter solute-binding subunit [Sneathiella marina]USG62082.1 TAXI family TRAP transporter solute-binding subunit [Sneathiella marina]
MGISLRLGSAAAAALLALTSIAIAEEVKLPSTVAWSAYNTGTTGYNQSVAIGKTLKDKYGVSLRVVPGKNDISRMGPLRNDKVQFVANGGGTFFGSEGVFNFAAPDWGPQRIQLIMSATSDANISLAVAADVGVKTLADLKGKRVGIVRGSPALTIGAQAHLAFADLTFDDVEVVEFGGYGAMWKGMVAGQVDAAIASTVSGPTKKLEASPRGIYWPPMPASDTEGWARVKAVAPYFVPHVATLGTGISKDNPVEGGAYPYPILITRADQNPELVYSMVKAVHTEYDNYKDALPAMPGWATERQTFMWAVPYHPAAVKYWKEAGAWTDQMSEHNDALLKRQDVLAAAWATMAAKNLEGDAFKDEWMKVRAAALQAEGMNPIWN